MTWRHIIISFLILTTISAISYIVGARHTLIVPVAAADPAVEYYTKNHSNGYAAIDRWAHYGMRTEHVIDVLANTGYDCQQLLALKNEGETGTIRDILCTKTESWPVSRNLTIQASIDYGVIGRLVAAKASSTLTSNDSFLIKHLADLLREMGWIEPATLQVTGLQIDSVEILTRMVADTLQPQGWHARCKHDLDEQEFSACNVMANERVKSGFPRLPEGSLPTGTALEIPRAMERVHFVPIRIRGADNKPEDSLLVRSTNGRIWMDFTSKDLVGRKVTASIELESKGGTPISLLVGLNGQSTTIPLAGKPRRANDGAFVYLVPEAGTQSERYSVWLHLPKKHSPASFEQLANNLPLIDKEFVEPMVKAVIDDPAINSRPEASLGLYPPLQQIEQKAEILHALNTEQWLPRQHGSRLIAEAYPEDPVVRAAWAFATCGASRNSSEVDGDCLLSFSITDPGAASFVRNEIARLQLLYRELPEDHPLRIRLRALDDAFSTERHDKYDLTAQSSSDD